VEADSTNILVQILAVIGAKLGRRSVLDIGTEGKLPANDFFIVVGYRASGRKGTAWNIAKKFMTDDESRLMYRGTPDSGEGLAKLLVEAGMALSADGKEFLPQFDINLLMKSSEVATMFHKGRIENSSLFPDLLKAWDNEALSKAKSREAIYIPNHCVSLVGHSQPDIFTNIISPDLVSMGLFDRMQVFLVFGDGRNLDPEIDELKIDNAIQKINAGLNPLIGTEFRYGTGVKQTLEARYKNNKACDRDIRHIQKHMLKLAAARGDAELSHQDAQAAFVLKDYSDACLRELMPTRMRVSPRDIRKVFETVSAACADGKSITSRQLQKKLGWKVQKVREIIQILLEDGKVKTQNKNVAGGTTVRITLR
jgi:hypothetical protein